MIEGGFRVNGDRATSGNPSATSRRFAVGRFAVTLLALLLGAFATAFSPPAGSDVMVTDASGARFIGVGRMNEQGLVLELTERRSQVRFVVVPPGGEPESFRGALRNGRLLVEVEEGTFTDLETLLGEQERRLVVTWSEDARDASDEAPPSDRGDPPGGADGDDAAPPGEDDDDDDDGDGDEGDADEPPGDDERPEGGEPSDEPDEGEEDADDEDDGLLPVDPPPPPSDDTPDPPLDAPDVDVDVGLP
jgi:hypothetical protein